MNIPLYEAPARLDLFAPVFAYFGSVTTLSITFSLGELSTIEVSPSMSVLEWIRSFVSELFGKSLPILTPDASPPIV